MSESQKNRGTKDLEFDLSTEDYEKKYPGWNEIVANRKAKDSVFTDLFSDMNYLCKLYQALCPGEECSSEELEIVSLENVLLTGSYNDLGFIAKNKLLILVEAQSSWNPNIPVRMLNYLACSYREYERKHGLNNYGSKAEKYPLPEFYMIYTGGVCPEDNRKLHLKDCFLGEPLSGEFPIDCVVNVIDCTNSSGILTEYISFCTILTDMVRVNGRTLKAITETIRVCKTKDILRSYFESREVEVTRILSQLFDQETAVKNLVRSIKREYETKLEEAETKLEDTETKLEDTETKLENSIQNVIALSFKLELSEEEIISKISQDYNLSYKESKGRVLKYKKSNKE